MTRSAQLPYLAYVTAFLQTEKERQFRFGDAMTSNEFLVIGHRDPAGVSFAGNKINRTVKTL